MNLITSTSKLISLTVESLKDQPLILALIIINLLFLGTFGFILHEIATITSATNVRRDAVLLDLIKACTTKP